MNNKQIYFTSLAFESPITNEYLMLSLKMSLQSRCWGEMQMAVSHQDRAVAYVHRVRPARSMFNAHVDGSRGNAHKPHQGYNQNDDKGLTQGVLRIWS